MDIKRAFWKEVTSELTMRSANITRSSVSREAKGKHDFKKAYMHGLSRYLRQGKL
jgi:hypothetical protein